MATHEALRHEPPVRLTDHVRVPHALGVEHARQSVEELGRGGY